MKVVVNQSNCIGCGACESICPGVFQINDEGVSSVIAKEEDFTNQKYKGNYKKVIREVKNLEMIKI